MPSAALAQVVRLCCGAAAALPHSVPPSQPLLLLSELSQLLQHLEQLLLQQTVHLRGPIRLWVLQLDRQLAMLRAGDLASLGFNEQIPPQDQQYHI